MPTPSRRDFLRTSALAGGFALTGAHRFAFTPTAVAPQRILILGGTGYIGPYLVRLAVQRGHHVTTFTRGRRDADLPDSVERLTGDRNGQLDALRGKTWDVVIDDSATNPDWVKQSTELLRNAAPRYVFTSSTGVYYPYLKRGYTEDDAPHLEMADPKNGSENYGVSKAQCERQARDVYGDRALIIRPTYIVGPGDNSDRFPYWPVRLAQGGEVLAPGKRDDPVAFIDVRDLVAFYLTLIEAGRGGIFNAVGPRAPMTTREFYERAQRAINPSARMVYVEDYAFLTEHKIEYSVPWVKLEGNDYGHQSIAVAKSFAAGLTARPVEETLRDTLAWWPSVPEARRAKPKWAIQPDVEAAALAAWKARHPG